MRWLVDFDPTKDRFSTARLDVVAAAALVPTIWSGRVWKNLLREPAPVVPPRVPGEKIAGVSCTWHPWASHPSGRPFDVLQSRVFAYPALEFVSWDWLVPEARELGRTTHRSVAE